MASMAANFGSKSCNTDFKEHSKKTGYSATGFFL